MSDSAKEVNIPTFLRGKGKPGLAEELGVKPNGVGTHVGTAVPGNIDEPTFMRQADPMQPVERKHDNPLDSINPMDPDYDKKVDQKLKVPALQRRDSKTWDEMQAKLDAQGVPTGPSETPSTIPQTTSPQTSGKD